MTLDLEPIKTFLSEDTTPKAFSKLLDELLFDYMTILIKIQLSDSIDNTIHERAEEFIHYIKLLRDILPLCDK